MPLELGVWRIDQGLELEDGTSIDLESRLEDILKQGSGTDVRRFR